jgi:hypothetical protein
MYRPAQVANAAPVPHRVFKYLPLWSVEVLLSSPPGWGATPQSVDNGNQVGFETRAVNDEARPPVAPLSLCSQTPSLR